MNDRRKRVRERLRRRRESAKLREQLEKQAAAVRGSVSSSRLVAEDRNVKRQHVIDALERDVEELSRLSVSADESTSEIERLRHEVEDLKREFYTHLGAWQRVQIARHPQRPYTEDYV